MPGTPMVDASPNFFLILLIAFSLAAMHHTSIFLLSWPFGWLPRLDCQELV